MFVEVICFGLLVWMTEEDPEFEVVGEDICEGLTEAGVGNGVGWGVGWGVGIIPVSNLNTFPWYVPLK